MGKLAEKGEIQTKKKNFLEIVIYILFGLGPLTGNVIQVLQRAISEDFNVTNDQVLFSITAFMVPFALIQLISGAISDSKGRFPVIIGGLVIFNTGMLISMLSISFEMFIISNVIAGIGFGFVNPVLIALISDISRKADIPKKMGYLGAIANLMVGIGPFIAGQMVILGWESVYILFFSIGILSLFLLFFVKRPPQENLGGGMRQLISDISLEIKRPSIILLISSSFLISHTFLAINIWTSRALSEAFSETIIGNLLLISGLIGAIAGLSLGIIIKFKGPGLALMIGWITLFIGLILLVTVDNITINSNLIQVGLGLGFSGLSGGILLPVILFYSQILSPSRRGVLAGLVNAGNFIGIALVPLTFSPLYDPARNEIKGIYYLIIGLSCIFVILGLLLLKSGKNFSKNDTSI